MRQFRSAGITEQLVAAPLLADPGADKRPIGAFRAAADEARNYGEADAELLILTDAEVRPERCALLGP